MRWHMVLTRFLDRWLPALHEPASNDTPQEALLTATMDERMHAEIERQIRWLETKADVMRAERQWRER